MSCRSTKCENYEAMRELFKVDGSGDGWCLQYKRFYPDKFKEIEQ